MTPMRCAVEVAAFLQKKFDDSDYHATDEKVADKSMHVFAGFMPRGRSDEEKAGYDPCIVVRPVRVTDTREGSEVDLELVACTYNRSVEDGHLELYHALELCRQWLHKEPVVASMFQLQMPVETHIQPEQPYPEWLGWMKLTYSIGLPGVNIRRLLDDEKNFY